MISVDSVSRIYNAVCFMILLSVAYFWSSGFSSEMVYGWQYRGQEVSWFFFSLVVVSTFTGVFLGLLYEHVNEGSGAAKWWNSLSSLVQTKRFGSALIAAPLIVYSVFNAVYDESLDGAIFFSCLQSGFFWERTFKLVSIRH